MNVNSHEVQWWQATSQVNEEVSKHMYFILPAKIQCPGNI